MASGLTADGQKSASRDGSSDAFGSGSGGNTYVGSSDFGINVRLNRIINLLCSNYFDCLVSSSLLCLPASLLFVPLEKGKVVLRLLMNTVPIDFHAWSLIAFLLDSTYLIATFVEWSNQHIMPLVSINRILLGSCALETVIHCQQCILPLIAKAVICRLFFFPDLNLVTSSYVLLFET